MPGIGNKKLSERVKVSELANIFKSYDIRGKVGSELTVNVALRVGQVFADWLPNKGPVAIGRDMRPDSAELAQAMIKGLTEQGRDVWDIGEVTSDMIYFAVGKYKLAGGAVITASHNTGAYNGIKLYRDQVIAVGLDSGLDKIRDRVLDDDLIITPAAKQGSLEPKNIIEDWVNHCLSFTQQLKPFHIAIDTGNGMAGAVLPKILPKLPLTVDKMYFEVDGTFPNHEANPQELKNLDDLIRAVTTGKLDFGIAFDGDGDRAVFVDDAGRPVQGSDFISIVAKLYLEKYPGSKIVYDVRTSRATQELIKEWGGTPVRTKAGRVNIGPLMRQIGAPFGGETTGHLFFKENYDADSGLIAALVAMQALSQSDKKLSELVDEYRRYQMIPEKNISISRKPDLILHELQEVFKDGKQDLLDGLTVWYPDYWFNLRVSNTEPVMRLNAEAKTRQQLDELVAKVIHVI
jgi:phosphomannomutase